MRVQCSICGGSHPRWECKGTKSAGWMDTVPKPAEMEKAKQAKARIVEPDPQPELTWEQNEIKRLLRALAETKQKADELQKERDELIAQIKSLSAEPRKDPKPRNANRHKPGYMAEYRQRKKKMVPPK